MISLLFQATLLEAPKVQGLPNNWVGESALPGNCSTPRGGTEVHLLPRMNLQADVADRLRGVFGGRTVDKNPRSLCVDSVPGTAGLWHTFLLNLQQKPLRWYHHAHWTEEETEAGVKASKIKLWA